MVVHIVWWHVELINRFIPAVLFPQVRIMRKKEKTEIINRKNNSRNQIPDAAPSTTLGMRTRPKPGRPHRNKSKGRGKKDKSNSKRGQSRLERKLARQERRRAKLLERERELKKITQPIVSLNNVAQVSGLDRRNDLKSPMTHRPVASASNNRVASKDTVANKDRVVNTESNTVPVVRRPPIRTPIRVPIRTRLPLRPRRPLRTRQPSRTKQATRSRQYIRARRPTDINNVRPSVRKSTTPVASPDKVPATVSQTPSVRSTKLSDILIGRTSSSSSSSSSSSPTDHKLSRYPSPSRRRSNVYRLGSKRNFILQQPRPHRIRHSGGGRNGWLW